MWVRISSCTACLWLAEGSALPKFDKPAMLPQHRIRLRQLNLWNRLQRLRMRFLRWPHQIHRWPRRIGADHGKIAARRQALMPGAGGQDRNIAGGNFQHLALVAAEAHLRMAARDAEHLMHGGVIVHKIVDAVAPHRAPAVGAEQSFNRLFGMVVVDSDHALVDQEWHRVVRHEAVVFEDDGAWFWICADDGHGQAPES